MSTLRFGHTRLDAIEALRAAGFELVRERKHQRWRHPKGVLVSLSRTANAEIRPAELKSLNAALRLVGTT